MGVKDSRSGIQRARHHHPGPVFIEILKNCGICDVSVKSSPLTNPKLLLCSSESHTHAHAHTSFLMENSRSHWYVSGYSTRTRPHVSVAVHSCCTSLLFPLHLLSGRWLPALCARRVTTCPFCRCQVPHQVDGPRSSPVWKVHNQV